MQAVLTFQPRFPTKSRSSGTIIFPKQKLPQTGLHPGERGSKTRRDTHQNSRQTEPIMDEAQPRSIGIWLESLCSSTGRKSPNEVETLEAKDKAILALLAKLALHYWRPDFTPQQAKHLYADYLEDLRQYALSDISEAIAKYRQSGAKFYPQSGELVKIIRTVPSWDIRTAKEHSQILHETARKELQGVMARIETGASKLLAAEYR